MKLQEVQSKLVELKAASPEEARSLFASVETELSNFLTGGDLNEVAYDALKHVVFDGLMSGLSVEHPELLPALSAEHPVGYENVTDLLGSGLEEITAIDTATFLNGYSRETVMEGQVGVTKWHHQLLEQRWPSLIVTSKNTVSDKLERLSEYCRGRFESWTLPLIFEEVGKRHNEWTENRREFAHSIYIMRGWGEFIDTLNLQTYKPSYVDELNEDDD